MSTSFKLAHLQRLEAESIHIFREVVAEFQGPVMLHSIAKELLVNASIAQEASYPSHLIS